MNNIAIEAVQQQRDLGVIVTENLKHDKQAEKSARDTAWEFSINPRMSQTTRFYCLILFYHRLTYTPLYTHTLHLTHHPTHTHYISHTTPHTHYISHTTPHTHYISHTTTHTHTTHTSLDDGQVSSGNSIEDTTVGISSSRSSSSSGSSSSSSGSGSGSSSGSSGSSSSSSSSSNSRHGSNNDSSSRHSRQYQKTSIKGTAWPEIVRIEVAESGNYININ
ncbi:hypothetical protein FHG87_004017 [Trinorchestia longiramus]|nr:hypothetical protein FHG87_004017 [Trinorchestia longiramus]